MTPNSRPASTKSRRVPAHIRAEPVDVRLRLLLPLTVTAVLLTGCRTELRTDAAVTASGVETATVTLRFTDEAAAAVIENPDTDQDLFELVAEATGSAVERRTGDNEIVYVADVDPQRLDALGPYTGLDSVSVTAEGDRIRADVVTVAPERLLAAIDAAAAGEPDADILVHTYRSSTTLTVRLTFPGDVISTDAGDVEGHSVELSDTLVLWEPSTVTITASATGSFPVVPIGVTVLVVTGAGYAFFSRSRRISR